MSHRAPSAIRRAASDLEILRTKRAQCVARLAQINRDILTAARLITQLVGDPLLDIVTTDDDKDSLSDRLQELLMDREAAANGV